MPFVFSVKKNGFKRLPKRNTISEAAEIEEEGEEAQETQADRDFIDDDDVQEYRPSQQDEAEAASEEDSDSEAESTDDGAAESQTVPKGRGLVRRRRRVPPTPPPTPKKRKRGPISAEHVSDDSGDEVEAQVRRMMAKRALKKKAAALRQATPTKAPASAAASAPAAVGRAASTSPSVAPAVVQSAASAVLPAPPRGQASTGDTEDDAASVSVISSGAAEKRTKAAAKADGSPGKGKKPLMMLDEDAEVIRVGREDEPLPRIRYALGSGYYMQVGDLDFGGNGAMEVLYFGRHASPTVSPFKFNIPAKLFPAVYASLNDLARRAQIDLT